MAKEIKISDDSGSNWYTLPGSTGGISRDRGAIPDTIFGQTFQSNEVGLNDWNVAGQGLYKGFGGYVAKILQQDTSTAMTQEACTLVPGTTKTYQIDDAAKQIWDRSVAITVRDNAADVTAEVEKIDYLFGKITFKASYTVTGAVDVSGNFFTTKFLGKSNGFTLTQTADLIDTSVFETVQANGFYRTRNPGLRIANLDLTGVFDSTNTFKQDLAAGNEIIAEINPDGNNKSVARGFYRPSTHAQTGDVGALEEENVTLLLNVPDDPLLDIPFGWQHASDTTLSLAIRKTLDAWINETKLDVRYFPDGEGQPGGEQGKGVVAEATLTGGLEVMNEFAFTYQGDGALSNVP